MADVTPDDDAQEVEETNARFYRAFENMDLAEMDRLWCHREYVRCVHPGWGLLEGWGAVRQSWESIFKGSGEMRFSLGDVQIRVGGDLAWVTCTENILSEVRGTIAVTAVLATNVFERRGREWLLVHHHASHILTAGPPESA
ncbi:MAG: nuclear transport factor 2 family protein [Candidatus Rokubacteria bacterium]|nr:nuclear transport factor 2 family protein [Candidatus Rokubacteria bacterium]